MLEKVQLEELLGMEQGYVLDFTNRTFAEFFNDAKVAIYANKYAFRGDSKANRLRAFWAIEPDIIVGRKLHQLIDYWRYKNRPLDAVESARAQSCDRIINRLLGKQVRKEDPEKQFLKHDFGGVSLKKIQIDATLIPILESRFAEATRCLENDAPLAAIFLCGSILEGLLLGVACANPQAFNQASSSPKGDTGKVKQFHDWTLAELIDVACKLGYLKLDVKKFSHVLRDFRNYIHPYQQMSSQFNPDGHTAQICLQVLRAAIASLSGQRS